MYIKIGTTDIKYLSSQDDYMIISEVVDSSLSYEKPTLVRTSDELDIWFGKNFPDRSYLDELLESKVTLFLYKPVEDKENSKEDNYIDIDSFEDNTSIYYLSSDLPNPGEYGIKYRLKSDTGKYIDKTTDLRFDFVIWLDSQYVFIKDLPQSLDQNNTESLNNRDVLSINYNETIGPSYSYPEYKTNLINQCSFSGEDNFSYIIDEELLLEHLPDLEKVNAGYETLAYTLTFDENINFYSSSDSPYIIISGVDKDILLYFDSGNGIPGNVAERYYSESIKITVDNKTNIEIISNIMDEISKLGYIIIKKSDFEFQIYSSFKTVVKYFYNLDGFFMTPSFDITHDILSQLSNNSRRITFVSKTIGTDDEKIKVNIEKLQGKDNYRIIISRFNYSETYEGSLFGLSNRIDYIISNNSKLVYCDLIQTYINTKGEEVQYKLEDEEEERKSSLPEGTWELRRAKVEVNTPSMYKKAINSIFNNGDTIFFDFFLVPNIKYYTSGLSEDLDYYPEYINFLKYSKLINCQFLIQNTDTGWKYEKVLEFPKYPEEGIVYEKENEEGGSTFMAIINGVFQETTDREIINQYGNDFIFNYTEDIENRLVYFYRPLKILGNDRPAYYLYLDGLLKDTYSISVNDVLYDCPVSDPYKDEDSIEEKLQEYKSNYLVDNNQIYYYKKYQNGDTYYTSNWMRFTLGKIQRELEKNKWKFLSERMSGRIQDLITDILNKIANSYSIIRSITLDKFKLDYTNNKLDLTVSTYMSDLINNNISLDITLNYNK